MANEFLERLGQSVGLRLATMAVLTLILMIPLAIVGELVNDRSIRHDDTVLDIGNEWSGPQTLLGPVVVVPFLSSEYVSGDNPERLTTLRHAFFLPEMLNITGTIEPEIRYRGIYQTILYTADLTISGTFPGADFSTWSVEEDAIRWQEAFIAFGITDMRGIKDEILLNWSDTTLAFGSGMQEAGRLVPAGISSRIAADTPSEFSFNLKLDGNDELLFVPVGKTTHVELSSSWDAPSFGGAFLPDERTVTDDGFSASWQVLDLNRPFGQSWRDETTHLLDSAFGLSLYPPVDQYRKTQRSTRYGFLLVGLTLLAFFLIELRMGLRAHPFQYILIGLDLCLFFLMLLSLGEHLPFNSAYIISGVATIGLAALYAGTIYRSSNIGVLTAGILVILYTFIFLLLQLQDYALFAGSIGLLLLLALTMYLTRNFADLAALSLSKRNE
ncbi:MAG: cell envelope integrity protein CreD [Bacteroidetes bacterium]|nr:cell envelope integrity protein CreD [Bacteroidota bacterium]